MVGVKIPTPESWPFDSKISDSNTRSAPSMEVGNVCIQALIEMGNIIFVILKMLNL